MEFEIREKSTHTRVDRENICDDAQLQPLKVRQRTSPPGPELGWIVVSSVIVS